MTENLDLGCKYPLCSCATICPDTMKPKRVPEKVDIIHRVELLEKEVARLSKKSWGQDE